MGTASISLFPCTCNWYTRVIICGRHLAQKCCGRFPPPPLSPPCVYVCNTRWLVAVEHRTSPGRLWNSIQKAPSLGAAASGRKKKPPNRSRAIHSPLACFDLLFGPLGQFLPPTTDSLAGLSVVRPFIGTSFAKDLSRHQTAHKDGCAEYSK